MKLLDVLPLLEARKNPEQNVKLPAYKQIWDYVANLDESIDVNDLFISFTNIEKLGINPLYGYHTPMGIYFFPLAEIWEHYNISKAKSFNKTLPPVVRGRPYIQLVQYNGKGHFIRKLSEYTDSDLNNDIKKIKQLIPNDRLVVKDIEDYDTFIEEAINGATPAQWDFYPSPARKFFNICRTITYAPSKTLTKKLVHSKEDEAYYQKFEQVTPNQSSRNWNWLLRELGYAGMCDNAGNIHENEYIQAFFVSTQYFNHLKTFTNTDELNMDELESHIKSGDIHSIINTLQGTTKPQLLKKYPQILDMKLNLVRSMSVILPFLKIFNIKLDNMHSFDDMLEHHLMDIRPFFEKGKWDALTYSNEVADKFLRALYNNYEELHNKYPTMNYKMDGKIAIMSILKDNPNWAPYFKQSQYYNKLVSL
jgi:hypothetical protein